MGLLLAAAAFFLFIHLGISGTLLRDRVVAAIGEGPYTGLFSVLSLGGIVWLSWAYGRVEPADVMPLWGPIDALRGPALVLVFFGFLFVVGGLMTPTPTAMGKEKLLDDPDAAVKGLVKITRHPFLWGVLLWAVGHLIVNGDLASVVLFGTFAVLALLGTRAIDAKRARAFGDQWASFAGKTSNVPFAALASGRSTLAVGELPWVGFIVGIVLFGAFLYFHAAIFSVSALG